MCSTPGTWQSALLRGLRRWCIDVTCTTELTSEGGVGVPIHRLRPTCPILFLSGCTPGPFYHSHPHQPIEFDHLSFDFPSQVTANLNTIRKIGDAVPYVELPWNFSGCMDWRKSPALVQWVSRNGKGFSCNAEMCSEVVQDSLSVFDLQDAEVLGTFEVGGNVSDRRFLLETYGMYALIGESLGEKSVTVRVDIPQEYDGKYFMPYVPGYVVCGPSDIVVFTVTAVDQHGIAPIDGSTQVEYVLKNLISILTTLNATFNDVVLCWNRVVNLDNNEEAVLMTRSRMGLNRPLAESVLEVVQPDRIGFDQYGTELLLEYIVVAQVPCREAQSRL